MSVNSLRTSAHPDAVFDVFDDAWAYPRWVLGTRRVRRVDPDWPEVGAKFHHAVGTAASELHDSSKVLERARPGHLALEVRFRPAGVARVDLDVTDGDDSGCVITLTEQPLSGPAAWLPSLVSEPLLSVRNIISLRRLRRIVERTQDRDEV